MTVIQQTFSRLGTIGPTISTNFKTKMSLKRSEMVLHLTVYYNLKFQS